MRFIEQKAELEQAHAQAAAGVQAAVLRQARFEGAIGLIAGQIEEAQAVEALCCITDPTLGPWRVRARRVRGST